jgi:hypothetical protein
VLGDVTKTVECHHLSPESAKLSVGSIQVKVLVAPDETGPTIGIVVVIQ